MLQVKGKQYCQYIYNEYNQQINNSRQHILLQAPLLPILITRCFYVQDAYFEIY